jgi:hypothetical protein
VNAKTASFTSFQLVGPRFSEAKLLKAGRLIETTCSVNTPCSRNAGTSEGESHAPILSRSLSIKPTVRKQHFQCQDP